MPTPDTHPAVDTDQRPAVDLDQRPAVDVDAGPASLVRLLGEQRAEIVERLRTVGEATVAELAEHLGISEVATRRHLNVLDDEGFVAARTVKQERGRPAATYHLTERARDLFPQRYAAVAHELLDFITTEHGREGLRSYLRWRLDREAEAYGETVTAEDLHDRLEQLAGALSANGFDARVREDDGAFELHQDHCAIYDVAKDHPEMCRYEAATFAKVLGRDVVLRRRATLTEGAHACVCTVTPKDAAASDLPTRRTAGGSDQT
jgi:predicted ArsR family transcriptional regulator